MTLPLLVALKTNTIVSCFLAVILGVTFAILGRPKKTKKQKLVTFMMSQVAT